jgi:hypothetical protein
MKNIIEKRIEELVAMTASKRIEELSAMIASISNSLVQLRTLQIYADTHNHDDALMSFDTSIRLQELMLREVNKKFIELIQEKGENT